MANSDMKANSPSLCLHSAAQSMAERCQRRQLSKVLAPGFRVGWVTRASRELLDKLVSRKASHGFAHQHLQPVFDLGID